MDGAQREDRAISSRTTFDAIAALPDAEIDLAAAALAVAADAYPDLDPRPYLARIDALAQRVRARIGDAGAGHTAALRAMNFVLFEEEGYQGNVEAYGDPRNSYLNEVMDRRLGIPITLSVLYLEIGWRLGTPLEGVSFPGHFLVKCPHGGGEVVLDPFFRGISLGEDDLLDRVQRATGRREPALLAHFLRGVSRREILARVLRNLKNAFAAAGEHARLLPVCEKLCLLAPGDADEIRDRGLAYDALDCPRAALADLRRYLDLAPDADDAESVRARVVDLHASASRLN